jgi:hypothetical protein
MRTTAQDRKPNFPAANKSPPCSAESPTASEGRLVPFGSVPAGDSKVRVLQIAAAALASVQSVPASVPLASLLARSKAPEQHPPAPPHRQTPIPHAPSLGSYAPSGQSAPNSGSQTVHNTSHIRSTRQPHRPQVQSQSAASWNAPSKSQSLGDTVAAKPPGESLRITAFIDRLRIQPLRKL